MAYADDGKHSAELADVLEVVGKRMAVAERYTAKLNSDRVSWARTTSPRGGESSKSMGRNIVRPIHILFL